MQVQEAPFYATKRLAYKDTERWTHQKNADNEIYICFFKKGDYLILFFGWMKPDQAISYHFQWTWFLISFQSTWVVHSCVFISYIALLLPRHNFICQFSYYICIKKNTRKKRVYLTKKVNLTIVICRSFLLLHLMELFKNKSSKNVWG